MLAVGGREVRMRVCWHYSSMGDCGVVSIYNARRAIIITEPGTCAWPLLMDSRLRSYWPGEAKTRIGFEYQLLPIFKA